MTVAEARGLVEEKLTADNLRKHVYAVEAVMRALARQLGEDEEKWALAGLLHDIDYEETKSSPERHGAVACEMLSQMGVDAEVLDAVRAHVGATPRATPMDKALYCADPVTGFIVACALIRPEKKLEAVALKSVKKRWKEKRFAAGASREQMETCSELGLSRDEFLSLAFEAMKGVACDLGL